MVSSAFQAFIGEEIASNGGTNLTSQCLYAFLRILILSGTFILVQRTLKFNSQKNRKALTPSRVPKASPKKMNGYKGKRNFNLPREDEDVSTATGSSDSDSDSTSTDYDENVKGARITMSELLRCRPAVGTRPTDGLHARPIGSSVLQPRRWDTVRSSSTVERSIAPTKAVSKATSVKGAKETVSNAATVKGTKTNSKAPCKIATVPKPKIGTFGDCSTVAANPERIQALLSIICPDEEAETQNGAKTDSPPWRQQMAFPPGLEPALNA